MTTDCQCSGACTLQVPAGETVAIVGATGAGKSTVIKLMLRFHDVTRGTITMDGHDLRELRAEDLRRGIGLGESGRLPLP